MSNWGEDQDYEAKLIKDYQGRFTINFKKIYMDVDEISERTLEITDKHPKDSLMKLWAGTMVGLFMFFILSYHVFALFMIPIMAFYIIALVRIHKCWRSFHYNSVTFWLMSIVTMAASFALSRVIQKLLEKLFL